MVVLLEILLNKRKITKMQDESLSNDPSQESSQSQTEVSTQETSDTSTTQESRETQEPAVTRFNVVQELEAKAKQVMDELQPLEQAYNNKKNELQGYLITLNHLTSLQINGQTPKEIVAEL